MNRKTEVVDDEVNELLPQDAHSPQDVDDLLGSIGSRGLDVVEGDPVSPFSALEQKLAQDTEEVELDLTPGAPDAASDPARAAAAAFCEDPRHRLRGRARPPLVRDHARSHAGRRQFAQAEGV